MNPNTRLAYSLIIALLVWAPGALLMFEGRMELTTGGLYFLGALVFAYVGVGLIGKMNDNYRQTARQVQLAKQQIEMMEQRRAEVQELQDQKRRKDDNPEA